MMLLASDGALQGDPAVLAAALDTGAGPSLGLPGAHLTTLFEPSPMAARRDRLDREEAPVLREGHPEVHALRLQLKARATGDPVAGFLAAAGDVMPWLLVVLAPALLLVLAPRVRRGRDGTGPALLLAGFGGAAAMTWQCVILLAWQLRFGNLGIRYGLLSGLFMAGLWAGARRPAAPGGAGLALRAALLLGTGALLLAALYLPAGPAAWLLLAGLSPGLGAATGAILPAAAAALSAAGDDPGRAAARLSVADHLGAVVASLAAGLVLLPRAGLSGTVALGGAGVLAAGILAALAPPGASGEPSRREVRRGRLALALLLVATVSLHRAVTQGGDGPGALPRAPVGAPAVAAPGWEARQEPFPHLLRRDAAGRVQRLRVTDGAPCFPGYEGPVRLHLDLDAAGTVLDARMGPHRETPAYVWGIEAWVHDLRGRRAAELHLAGEGPGEGLDALTGATVTCRSLLASARAASRAVESAAAASPGAPAAPGHAAAGDDPLPEPPRPPELPRLHRRDEVQTPHQRTVDRGALEERIREGTLSKRAAEHWLPVP
ncbi:MAG: FMN-binding protein [Deltaproteobacteria bacterium]|nr:FMN-binding protein [Deltaproteobacteria bacterium]